MSSKGGAIRLKNGLTPKQNTFKNVILQQIAEGKQPNATEAAMQAYDTDDKKTAGGIASENLQKPEIRSIIEEALNSNGVTEDRIIKNIKGIAETPPIKVTGETILKANMSLLKIMGHDNSGKQAKGKQVINNTIINIGYDEAKEKLQKMNTNAEQFINDADIL